MRSLSEAELQSISPLYWIVQNRFITENQKLLEFKQHRYLRAVYDDWSPYIVAKKASQVGWSMWALLRSLHLASRRGANVVYVLPTRKLSEEFLIPKFEPLIEHNPSLQSILTGTQNVSLKKVGQRYIYFRGAYQESEAIAISVDALIADEYDRSDQKILQTYRTRLDAADPELRFEWIFSNPSVPGFGVDELYEQSDQHQWVVTCNKGHGNSLSFPDSVCRERRVYQCLTCHSELTDQQRSMGEWVAKYPRRDKRGYWVSQLMVKSAQEILDKEKIQDPLTFHNFTLGLAWAPVDVQITRQLFIKNLVPGTPPVGLRVLGVDNGVKKHWVLIGAQGLIDYGVTEDWDEIEARKRIHGAFMVVDALPYPARPTKLAEKYDGKVWLHYGNLSNRREERMIRWGEGKKGHVVETDRTKIIDYIVSNLQEGRYVFYKTATQMEEFISHCLTMRRTTESKEDGRVVPKWITPEGKDDHYFFAWMLALVGLESASRKGMVVSPGKSNRLQQITDATPVMPTEAFDPAQLANEVLKEGGRDWRSI